MKSIMLINQLGIWNLRCSYPDENPSSAKLRLAWWCVSDEKQIEI